MVCMLVCVLLVCSHVLVLLVFTFPRLRLSLVGMWISVSKGNTSNRTHTHICPHTDKHKYMHKCNMFTCSCVPTFSLESVSEVQVSTVQSARARVCGGQRCRPLSHACAGDGVWGMNWDGARFSCCDMQDFCSSRVGAFLFCHAIFRTGFRIVAVHCFQGSFDALWDFCKYQIFKICHFFEIQRSRPVSRAKIMSRVAAGRF